MLSDAVLIAGKDLRIEWRSKVVINQLIPFSFAALILFGIAFDANRSLLVQLAPGLVWVTMLFASVLAAQRSFSTEQQDQARDTLMMSPLDPAGIFLGKVFTVVIQLALMQVAILIGILVLFGSDISQPGLLLGSSLLAIIGLSTISVLYGALTAGIHGGDGVLPLLILPVAAPVLLAATRAWEVGLGITAGSGWGAFPFLAAFAAVFLALGVLAFEWIMES